MLPEYKQTPVVMVVGGNDPTGGAGLAADIQTLAALACHAAPVVTAITIQDTTRVHDYRAVDADFVARQADAVLTDMQVAVVKTGMLVNASIVNALCDVLEAYPDIQLVVDPVLASNLGDSLSERSLLRAVRERLLRRAVVVTPNTPEAAYLSDSGSSDGSDIRCAAVLSTGTHTATELVENCLYQHGRLTDCWQWPRLSGEFHGSGCTLASAIAAGLARGRSLSEAAEQAQQYVYAVLQQALVAGRGQHIPDRCRKPQQG
jgi:hydroxymethylpyrimidine/phosphomethylpyrimidine kinase